MGENTLSTLVTEVSHALEPLTYSLSSPQQAQQLLAGLGWALPPGVSDIGLVGTDIQNLINAALVLARSTDAEWDDLTVIAERIGNVVAELGKVIQDVTTVANNLSTNPALPANYVAVTQMDTELVPRLLSYLIILYLQRYYYVLYSVLKLGGIIQVQPMDADSTTYQAAHMRLTLNFDALGALISPDRSWAKEIYGWGTPTADIASLINNIGELLASIGASATSTLLARPLEEAIAGHPVPEADANPMPVLGLTLLQGMAPDTYRVGLLLFEARASTAGGPDAGLGITPFVWGTANFIFPLPTASNRWSVVLNATADLAGGIAALWRPGSGIKVQTGIFGGPGALMASGQVALYLQYAVPTTDLDQAIFTLPGGTSFTLKGFKVGGGAQLTAQGNIDAFGEADLQGGKLNISLGGSDSFIAKLIPIDDLAVNVDLSLIYSQTHGLSVTGAAGFETAIAINADVGPFQIDTLHLVLSLGGQGLALEASLDGGGAIGPISASVQRIGAMLDLNFKQGNLGPLDLQFGFKPPTGLGLEIDAGPISGGGFISFDPAAGRYAGILSLSLESIAITAIGLLDTKLPGGQPGYSFLLIISVEFDVGIQLGMGFTLSGVGGLCGINRDMITDAIQAGLRDHSLDAMLFPPDPVQNAPKIISELSTIYPPAVGRYVFGPMLEIGYGTPTLVTAEIGVLIVVPSPIRIAILGQLRLALPDPDEPVIELHVDVLAVVDFAKQTFSLDATIHDSRIVLFAITGDIAFRLTWGDNPSFLFSVGGFNPHYQAPAGFPTLQRIALGLSEDVVTLTLQAYLAVTPNSFQMGAHLEIYIGAGSFTIDGWLGFDTLLIFSPFSLEVDFSAGLALKSGNSTLMGITVDGKLTGPTPWHAEGNANISVLFFSLSVHVSVSIGDPQSNPIPQINPWTPLLAAIKAQGNWSGALPSATPAVAKYSSPEKADAPVLIDPAGALTFRQKVLPLNQIIAKFGNATPDQQTEFNLSGVTIGGATAAFANVADEFSPGQFANLSDGDKLSLPSFEPMVAGFTVSDGAVAFGKQYDVDIEFETIIIDTPVLSRFVGRKSLVRSAAIAMCRAGAAANGSLYTKGLHASEPDPRDARLVSLDAEQYVIGGVDDMQVRSNISAPTTKSAAFAALARHVAANPDQQGQLQVIPAYELLAAA
jgi:hypothetical protein